MEFLAQSSNTSTNGAAVNGRIIKVIGGFYFVEAPNGVLSCRARGIFRKDDITPLVGDIVAVEMQADGTGMISGIYERRNSLTRPPLANLDRLLLVSSTTEPVPNTIILDKLIAIAEYKDIDPVIIITKTDLAVGDELLRIYRQAGFTVILVDNTTGEGVDEVCSQFEGKLCAFCGNSGVGKSSLLNNIDKALQLETAAISKKLGRGKHTTRHVELYHAGGGYIADTPGFSALDTQRYEQIHKESLHYCFREFAPYLNDCKFADCSHTKEQGCGILKAVEDGRIAASRHKSYLQMYEEAKQIKDWENKPDGKNK